MKPNRIYRQRGYTIIEAIVSAALILIVVTVIYNFYVLAKDVYLCTFEEGRMQAKAMYILERMIYGADTNRKGIQDARAITTPAAGASGSAIQFVDGFDPSVSRRFSLSSGTGGLIANEVYYTNESAAVSRMDVDTTADGDVTALTFARAADTQQLVTISITLSKTVTGKNLSVRLSASARARNMQ